VAGEPYTQKHIHHDTKAFIVHRQRRRRGRRRRGRRGGRSEEEGSDDGARPAEH